MLDFLKSAFPSATLAVVLVGACAWLLRRWIGERLTAGVRHEYDRRLAAFAAELKRHESFVSATTSSFLAAHAAAHDRTLKAVQELWDAVLRLRDAEPSIVSLTNYLLPEEVRLIWGIPDVQKNTMQELLKPFLSSEAERTRPFVGELLWSLFFGHRALMGRMCVLLGSDAPSAKSGEVIYYMDDPVFLELLDSLLTAEEVALVKLQKVGAYRLARNLVEQKIVLQARKVIEGEASVETALTQTKRIMLASEDALRPPEATTAAPPPPSARR